jgi:hypothetical protein
MKGTLWQEHAHDNDSPSLWRVMNDTIMHAGFLEMHPPDWIARVQSPPIRKTAFMFAVCTDFWHDLTPRNRKASIYPYPYLDDPPDPAAQFKQSNKLVDGRFSDASTFTENSQMESGSRSKPSLAVTVTVSANQHAAQGRFKAVYEVWWEMPLMASILPTSASVGSLVTLHVHAEDSSTHQAVVGIVKAAGRQIGTSGGDFTHVFEPLDMPLMLSAQGYADIAIPFRLIPGWLGATSTRVTTGQLIPVTVSATNAAGEAVTDGDVYINQVKVGRLGVPFTYTFHSAARRRVFRSPKLPPVDDGGGGGGPGIPTETGFVHAQGYAAADIVWNTGG